MSKDLLSPRYEVIADWPESRYYVGAILLMDEKGYYSFDPLMYETSLNKYPHLFSKLQWWEKREKAQLPEYVKNNKVVIKITVGNDMSESGEAWMFEKSPDGLRHRLDLKYYEPSTESEYEQYLKSKTP